MAPKLNCWAHRSGKWKWKWRNQEFRSCIANVLALATGGQLWTKSVNVTLIPPTITSGPPGSWITRVCQYPRPEKWWRDRGSNPGLPLTWQTLYHWAIDHAGKFSALGDSLKQKTEKKERKKDWTMVLTMAGYALQTPPRVAHAQSRLGLNAPFIRSWAVLQSNLSQTSPVFKCFIQFRSSLFAPVMHWRCGQKFSAANEIFVNVKIPQQRCWLEVGMWRGM